MRGFEWAFPRTKQRITRTLTIDHTQYGKDVPYIDFDAVVGRNSTFINLTEEQLEVLGGAEYIALKFLLKVVAGVSIRPKNPLLMNDHSLFSSITSVFT